MHMEIMLDPQFIGRAVYLLNAGGYERATPQLLVETPLQKVAWILGGASSRRRKTVLELIELACGDVA